MAVYNVPDNTYQSLIGAVNSAANGDTVRLTQDITDFTGYTGPYALTKTDLTLDGDYHNIGIYIPDTSFDSVDDIYENAIPGPLFGDINGANVVQGLTVRNLNVYFGPPPETPPEFVDGRTLHTYQPQDTSTGGFEGTRVYYGGLVTSGSDCSFINVNADGHLNLVYEYPAIMLSPGKEIHVGGIAGRLTGACEFINCVVGQRGIGLISLIKGVNDALNFAVTTSLGGMLGQFDGASLLMRDCRVETSMNKGYNSDDPDLSGYAYVGGMAGSVIGGECLIEDCKNYAYIVAQYRVVGGIAGYAKNTVIRSCDVDGYLDQGQTFSAVVEVGGKETLPINDYGGEFWVCEGGIAGWIVDSQTYRCHVGSCIVGSTTIEFVSTDETANAVGGIVGLAESTASGMYGTSVIYCSYDSTFMLSSTWSYVGGIVGRANGIAGYPVTIRRNIFRGTCTTNDNSGSSFGGIVGGARSCFDISYNRVCRPRGNSSKSLSVVYSDKIGGTLGEVIAQGNSEDGAMSITNNAVGAASLEASEATSYEPRRSHRVVGFIPPEAELHAAGGRLLLSNNYAHNLTQFRANDSLYDDGSPYYEYDYDHYSGDQGVDYGEASISDPDTCQNSTCIDPADDPAYGPNRSNGGNIPDECAPSGEETYPGESNVCWNCVIASLCGGTGDLPNAAPPPVKNTGFPCSCAEEVMDVVQGVIDSMASLQDAVNCYVNPGSCGPTGATGPTGASQFDCSLPYQLDPNDPAAWNADIAPLISRATGINDSIQRGICCVMNYVDCCSAAVKAGAFTRDVCLSARGVEDSTPKPGTTYTITLDGSNPPETYTQTADADGILVFTGLKPGTYHMESGSPGYPDFFVYDLVIQPMGSVSLLQTQEAPPFRAGCMGSY
ncbi:MAG: prealbumin-like fold domain-containing protein [Oscillospiraceae bacterium]|jgi:hypothetical protein|nr:prealbumin-like fold domain-containing protein [Oscillospiraceae bacterium]